MYQNKNPLIRGNSNNSYVPQQTNGGLNTPNQLFSFIQQYGNNPDKAKQEVEQLLQNGQMSQSQFDNFKNQVPNMMQWLGIK